jgi:hypothetical protein
VPTSDPPIYFNDFPFEPEGTAGPISGSGPSDGPPIIKPEYLASPPTQYAIASRYEFHMGELLVPVCGPTGTPPWVTQLHSPCWTKSVSWVAERVGEKPILPGWRGADPAKQRIQYLDIRPMAPVRGPDGRYVYKVRGFYQYVMLDAPPNNSSVSLGNAAMPFDLNPAVVHVLPGFTFDDNVLDQNHY